MPEIQTIDLRDEKYIPTGIGRIMSLPLVEGVENALKDNRQAILFLNRRGHSSFAQCTRCGHVPECGNCAISLTYHRNEKLLRCHYCGYSRQMLPSCPKCGGKLETRGVGTQQVEREIRHFFPQARVARMDKDTTRGKNAITTLLARFSRGEQDILVGTQMVAKGHDFPGVDFIGIIDADTGLHLPDYRASERTFQLLTQVAGRAGRGAAQGTVVIQTRDPEHYAIQAALDHDYQAFYKQEISFRESLKYPPSAAMALVRMTHVEEKVLKNCGLKTADMVREALGHAGVGVGDWAVLGPAPAPFARLRGKFRYNLILRAATRDVLHEFLRGIEKELRKLATEMGVSESIDLYPASFL